jgi:hypothetical protein
MSMPEDEIPDDADIVLPAGELDQIFFDIYMRADVEVDPEYYRDAYMSGWEDGAKALHHEVMENAEILIE